MSVRASDVNRDIEIGETSLPCPPETNQSMTRILNQVNIVSDTDQQHDLPSSLPTDSRNSVTFSRSDSLLSPPPPQDITQLIRGRSYNSTEDELSSRRYFQQTASGTFRPITFRSSRSRQYNVIYKPNAKSMDAMMTKFFRWAFRSSFILLIIIAQISFFAWTCIFAFLHVWNVYSQPNCVNPPFDPRSEPFSNLFRDCWHLSWSTFATVGYGVIAPSTVGSPFYTNNRSPQETVRLFKMDYYCFAQSFLCSLEAFVGILFAGFWTAVLFSKVAKVNNKARVVFSSQLVVQYGIAVMSSKPHHHTAQTATYPCPILEFRILNRQHSQKGGGIINASVNVVASLRKEQLREHKKQKSSIHQFTSLILSLNHKKLVSDHRIHSTSNHGSLAPPQSTDLHRTHSSPSLINRFKMSTSEGSFDAAQQSPSPSHAKEYSHTRTAGAFVFTPLTVEPGNYPLFQNVWTIRHVLNDSSPLLKPKTRSAIKNHHGLWPADLCSNPQAVRNCIQFGKILVSFSGTSQLNASSVYSQHVYAFEDLFVGYEFENMLVMKPSRSISVNESNLSIVRQHEQSQKIMRHHRGYDYKIHNE